MVEMTFDIGLALAVVNAGIAALGMALAIFNMVLAVVGAEVGSVVAIFGMAFKLAAVNRAEVGLAVFNTVIFEAVVLSCQDPHPIAKIPSDPKLIPYCFPDSVLTIL